MKAAGLTVRQIAAALGITTQAVYKHLRKDRLNGQTTEKAS